MMTLTPDELAAIQARADAATEGPWLWAAVTGYGSVVHAAAAVVANSGSQSDAEFIAHARADIPALLAEVQQQAARIDKALALAESWRYKGEFGWGAWQEGHGPDQEGCVLDQAAADLRRALTEETP